MNTFTFSRYPFKDFSLGIQTDRSSPFLPVKILKPLIENFPKISYTYRYIRDSKFLFLQPKMTTLGFYFNGNIDMENGLFEPIETEIIKKLLTFIKFGMIPVINC